jgi:hypothetical protein
MEYLLSYPLGKSEGFFHLSKVPYVEYEFIIEDNADAYETMTDYYFKILISYFGASANILCE